MITTRRHFIKAAMSFVVIAYIELLTTLPANRYKPSEVLEEVSTEQHLNPQQRLYDYEMNTYISSFGEMKHISCVDCFELNDYLLRDLA
ncbi:hypothetical protein [Desulfuribacillus alkaliarsenatis]|uniref:Uncharacterized protein n=1 Tax=Desulfuribacillus alkaliarsenatis TaxID=766136 RepID=A0A1E5G4Z4_9FIRM|nr:hypothetical protein [Desulfuribacillus alkaliarsenatis]OEF98248.1 hypothetical protein BHF68_00755 [Desulfuribacillus alkaliarsenatis]